MLTVAHYCVLTSLSWPCKHHSALILSLLFYQACLEEGKFFVCDQISPIPDGKLLLNYIRNVSFTSRFRGPMTIKSINTRAKFALSLRTASCQVAACGIMSLTLSYQIYITGFTHSPDFPSWITYSWKFRELPFSVLHQFELNMSYKWCL